MINCDRPVPDAGRVKLSGVVTVPGADSQNGQWKEILISSLGATRFKNVLTRAAVLREVSWFWHRGSDLHLCDKAVAIVADNTNDYRQIIVKQNQLANTLQDLDFAAEVLLLVSSGQNFVFGTTLETGEMFSTHILFTQHKQSNEDYSQVLKRKELVIHNELVGCV